MHLGVSAAESPISSAILLLRGQCVASAGLPDQSFALQEVRRLLEFPHQLRV
jgi:hypothetical protein